MQDLPKDQQVAAPVPQKVGLVGHVSVTLAQYDADGSAIGTLPPLSLAVELLHPQLVEALELAAVKYSSQMAELKRLDRERREIELDAKRQVQAEVTRVEAELNKIRAEITAETGESPLSDDPRTAPLKARRKKLQELQKVVKAALAAAD